MINWSFRYLMSSIRPGGNEVGFRLRTVPTTSSNSSSKIYYQSACHTMTPAPWHEKFFNAIDICKNGPFKYRLNNVIVAEYSGWAHVRVPSQRTNKEHALQPTRPTYWNEMRWRQREEATRNRKLTTTRDHNLDQHFFLTNQFVSTVYPHTTQPDKNDDR